MKRKEDTTQRTSLVPRKNPKKATTCPLAANFSAFATQHFSESVDKQTNIQIEVGKEVGKFLELQKQLATAMQSSLQSSILKSIEAAAGAKAQLEAHVVEEYYLTKNQALQIIITHCTEDQKERGRGETSR